MFTRIAVYFVLLSGFLLLFAGCRSLRRASQSQNAVPAVSGLETAAGIRKKRKDSWVIPEVAPCALINKAEAETVMGVLADEPKLGGWQMDGGSCAYVAREPFVATVGLISPNSFELRKYEPGNLSVVNVGDEAYITKPNALEDVHLFACQGDVAVTISITAGDWDGEKVERYRIAKVLAQTALDRLLIKAGENHDN